MQWYCVRIDHVRLAIPINVTFRNMLVDEYRDLGEPSHFRVYRRGNSNGPFSYFFPPDTAAMVMAFLNFWNAYAVSEPEGLEEMEVVI